MRSLSSTSLHFSLSLSSNFGSSCFYGPSASSFFHNKSRDRPIRSAQFAITDLSEELKKTLLREDPKNHSPKLLPLPTTPIATQLGMLWIAVRRNPLPIDNGNEITMISWYLHDLWGWSRYIDMICKLSMYCLWT